VAIDANEQREIEEFIIKALSDASRTNIVRLKAGIRILMTTNIQTFETIASAAVQRGLTDFKDILLMPEKLAPKSIETELGKEEYLAFIRHFTLEHLHLLDDRTAILPNTYMVKKSIMEGEHLKSVVHASALKNVVASAHYIESLKTRFKKAGFSPEQIDIKIEKAIASTKSLHLAVLEGNISDILKCLSVSGVDINAPNELGMTPLHVATREGLVETVKLLLTVPGIDVNAVSNNGWTPLHFAARMGHADIADALLTIPNINVNAVNSDGWTPLHWAAWHGFTEIVTVLIIAPNIQINITDRNKTTPLHWAARNGHPDVISILLALPNIEVNPIDIEQHTPLHYAVIYNHEDATQVLLKFKKVDVNLADMDGLTALHWAARNGHINLIKLLLAHPDIRLQELDHNQMTPLDWAKHLENKEVITLLSPYYPKPIQKPSFLNSILNFFKKPATN